MHRHGRCAAGCVGILKPRVGEVSWTQGACRDPAPRGEPHRPKTRRRTCWPCFRAIKELDRSRVSAEVTHFADRDVAGRSPAQGDSLRASQPEVRVRLWRTLAPGLTMRSPDAVPRIGPPLDVSCCAPRSTAPLALPRIGQRGGILRRRSYPSSSAGGDVVVRTHETGAGAGSKPCRPGTNVA